MPGTPTGSSSRSGPTPGPEQRAGPAIGALTAAAWIAAVVAGNGFVSLFTGREVVPLASAGPLAAPVGIVVAAVAIGVRSGRATATSTLLPVECLLLGYVVPLLASAAVALVAGGIEAAVLLVGVSALSPFAAIGALLAGVGGLTVLLLVRARAAGAGRPRWPWERGGDD